MRGEALHLGKHNRIWDKLSLFCEKTPKCYLCVAE